MDVKDGYAVRGGEPTANQEERKVRGVALATARVKFASQARVICPSQRGFVD